MLKAYAVQEEDEGTGHIVYAEHAIVARRNGANMIDSEFEYVSCRRAPWADEYSGKPLPASVMIENGWWFECHGCGEKISDDSLADRDLPLDGVIGNQHSAVYCCQKCADDHAASEAKRKELESEAIAEMRAMVLARFPGVEFVAEPFAEHAFATYGNDGVWFVKQVAVSFKYPGMKIGPAHLRLDRESADDQKAKPQWSCCCGDVEAFEAFSGIAMERPSWAFPVPVNQSALKARTEG